MIDMTWTATPASIAGAVAARPIATGTCGVRLAAAPVDATRLAAIRMRPLTGISFGAGTAGDELHLQKQSTKNDPTLGIHSPGRPLS